MHAKKINVGFQKDGSNLLGLEVKLTKRPDIYVFVFEHGHRRMHISSEEENP
jgi:hypothetical protein